MAKEKLSKSPKIVRDKVKGFAIRRNAWIIFLVIYFLSLLVGSLTFAILIWDPIHPSSLNITDTNMTKTPQHSAISSSANSTTLNQSSALSDAAKQPTTITPSPRPAPTLSRSDSILIGTEQRVMNDSNGTKITNVTTYLQDGQKIEIRKTTANTLQVDKKNTEHEVRLVGLSALFGVVGSSVHGLTSLTVWLSRHKLARSYFAWYLTRPLIGAALAVIVYLLLRASLLSTVVNGAPASTLFINDFGVAAISGLIGLMTAQMTQKLRDVFDSLFGITKNNDKGDVGEGPSESSLILIPKELRVKVQQESVAASQVKDADGNPIDKVQVTFGIVDNKIAELLEPGDKETDVDGFAVARIRGNNEGNTPLIAAAKIGEETAYNNIKIVVTKPDELTEEGEAHSADIDVPPSPIKEEAHSADSK